MSKTSLIMDQEGEINSDVFRKQFPQVADFVKYLTYYRCILDAKLKEKSELFIDVNNAFFGAATLAWCNVFGSVKGSLHWSKTVRNMPEEVKQDFRDRIYRSTDLDGENYQEYQSSIKTLRDEYIAHMDLNWEAHILIVPFFDNALKVAKEYEKWVMNLLDKEVTSYSGPSLDRTIKTAKETVGALAKVLSS